MRKLVSLIMTLVMAASVGLFAADGFYTSGTKLMDANGNEFVMRGCNYSYAWQQGNENSVIPAAKRIGCNAIRIQLSTGRKWNKTSKSQLERLIRLCEDNKLVAIFNTHDETGSDNYSDLENAAKFWIEYKDVLNAHRKTVLVNISNEWYGTWNSQPWAEGYKKVIPMLRNAGIKNTLIVDCAGWGQYPKSLFDYGRQVAQTDNLNNIVFSIHMYEEAGKNESVVRSNIDNGLKLGVPLIIGEFAYKHKGQNVAWQTILDYTAEKNVGYLVWSWTGNGGGAEDCDMFGSYDDSYWKPNGTNTVNGRNGIKATSKECGYYSGVTGGEQGGGEQGGGNQGGDTPGGDVTPGETIALWSGSVEMASWTNMMEYKNESSNSQWKNDAMKSLAEGDKLVFSYTGVSTDEKTPGQIQLVGFGTDANWTWTEVVKFANIENGKYTYTISNDVFGDFTDIEMFSNRGFAVKGQGATLVKVELVKKGTQGGGQGGGDQGGDGAETTVDTPNYNLADWNTTEYHLTKEKLGKIESTHTVRLYVSTSGNAEVQVAYKNPTWTTHIEYAPISAPTYDLKLDDSALLAGAKADGLYFKGHDYTIQKVTVLRPGASSGIGETTLFDSQAPEIDFGLPYEIYSLDGRQVPEMLPGRLYILRQGAAVVKYLAR